MLTSRPALPCARELAAGLPLRGGPHRPHRTGPTGVPHRCRRVAPGIGRARAETATSRRRNQRVPKIQAQVDGSEHPPSCATARACSPIRWPSLPRHRSPARRAAAGRGAAGAAAEVVVAGAAPPIEPRAPVIPIPQLRSSRHRSPGLAHRPGPARSPRSGRSPRREPCSELLLAMSCPPRWKPWLGKWTQRWWEDRDQPVQKPVPEEPQKGLSAELRRGQAWV
jgi:hypothetical protein